MSDETPGPAAHDETPEDPSGLGPSVQASLAERYAIAQKAEGILAPVLTALLAFFVGGLVVLVTTGKSPIATYQAIFDGSGLNWLFPWISGAERTTAALNFQQTLLITTPLILTGLAVAFAFRCGMFNIGGQGQYLVGLVLRRLDRLLDIGFEPVRPRRRRDRRRDDRRRRVGGDRRVPEGDRGSARGDHDDHAQLDRDLGGAVPLRDRRAAAECRAVGDSDLGDRLRRAKLPVFWGDPDFQGLSIGIFIAVAALVVYWVILNRTTLGYGVKAVGFNPEAARYGGINVSRNYFLAMAISGTFAGLAGALDILGWQFHIATSDITPRRSDSSASPSRCSGETPRSASGCRHCCSPRSSTARRPATSTPLSSNRSSRRI